MYSNFQFHLFLLLILIGCNKGNSPVPEEPKVTDYEACLSTTSNESLEVVTWNLEHYPLTEETLAEVKNVILNLDADVVALQEISSSSVFDELVINLDGWEGTIAVSGTLNLAYLYKPSEIELMDPLGELYTDNSSAFPRPPALIKVKHNSDEIYLINIHLKCCDGTTNIERRMEASRLLKEYIDTNLPTDKVILLGDFNDEIYATDGSEKTFNNFIDDPDNYLFADMELAKSDESNWSYPSWPSHIDHILITNEFFSSQVTAETLALGKCFSAYSSKVSDHRPVFMRVE